MKEYLTEIEIQAPAKRVWQLLTFFERFPQWNPFIRRVEGCPREGEWLDMTICTSRGREMPLQSRVLRVEPERELRWRQYFFFPGLFDGVQSFSIEPLDAEHVCFRQRGVFSGLLVPLFERLFGRANWPGAEAMNRALRDRAEGLV